MREPIRSDVLQSLFAGDGEMSALMRSHDWSKTPLGPVEHWPQSLRTTVSIILNSRYPMFIFWGPKLVKLYNDGYRPILGTKHPHALGLPGPEIWPEIWGTIGPMVDQVITRGEPTWSDNLLLFMHRSGYSEEVYFTFSYSPIRDETGGIGGMFCACTETTQQVLGERRLRSLRDLAAQAGEAKTAEAACQIAIQTLGNNPADIPFALLYLLDAEGQAAHLTGITGLAPNTAASPPIIDLTEQADASGWPLAKVASTARIARVEDVSARFGPLTVGPWEDAPHTALVLPIASPGQDRPTALLVAGISSRRALDEDYQGFLELVAGQVASAIADARAYEAERQRAEALAELDQAKTVFFSNISHEFRTPLTLMLAPIEDALADQDTPLPAPQSQRIEIAKRNGLRLLKLVNTLLDFSRIEAGRVQAVYEPTDLAALTAELASSFRSLVEREGMALVVDCPPLPEAIFVDREMWEKIVLNLLSNAFKFTFTGTITVQLHACDHAVELTVTDTGIGIPAREIPHLFKRFHRVKGAQGRSFEGSGIGLSLVQELVKLHGGSVRVTSEWGHGSCFIISLPTGTAHLPGDRIWATRTLASTALDATSYVEEAWRWLSVTSRDSETALAESRELELPGTTIAPACPIAFLPSAQILVVDDNADMRDYLRRLLEQHYQVTTAEDGIAALQVLRQHKPDLVLTDVMMPRLDGFGLLRALRMDSQIRELPIILLSARAGEEARIAGLAAGADDYLTKPFSSRELLARVEASLKMAQIRRESGAREQALRQAAEQAQQEAESVSERLAQILESMSDSFVALDQDWRIIYQNAASERINGKPRSQVLGKTLWEEWPAAINSNLEYQYRRAIAEQVPVHFEHRYYAPPQYDVWLEIDAYPFNQGLGLFYRDITERKQAEVALRERERLFTTLAEVSPVTIFRFDCASNCIYVNRRWTELTGRAPETALGMGWVETLHPEDRDRLTQAWLVWCQQAQPDQPYQNEGRCIRLDGSVVWYYIQALPELDLKGETVGYIGVLTDITTLKQTEAALRDSQRQLQQQLAEIEAIYQSAPIGLNFLDPELRFVRINQRLAEMNGLSVDAHIGHTLREILPDLADAAEQLLLPILKTGEPLLNVELTGETPAQPGVQRTWLEHFLPLKSADQIIGISTVCEEITERKQAEAALKQAKDELEIRVAERTQELRQINRELQQSESTLRSFFDSGAMQMGIVELHGDDFLYISVNPAAAKFWGIHPEAMRHRFASELALPQPVIQQWAKHYRQAEQLRVPVQFEYLHATPDGLRWLSASVCLISISTAGYARFSYIAEDITDRKQAEDQLRQSESKFRSLSESAPVGIFLLDRAGHCTYTNPRYQEIVGCTAEAARSHCWIDFVHPEDRQPVQTQWSAIVEQHQQGFYPEIRYPHADHSLRYGRVYISPVTTSDSGLASYVGTVEDITEQRKIDQMKQEFVSIVSHELRTPLTAMHGALGLLATGIYDQRPEKRKKMLEIAARETDRLVRLVNDILSLRRLESGQISLVKQGCRVPELVTQAVEAMRSQAESEQIAIAATPLDIQVWANPDALIQTLTNLLSNAIKFSPAHSIIHLKAELVESWDTTANPLRPALQPPFVLFSVHDQGRGIPRDRLGKIFEQFQQVDSSDAREKGGTGLGLTICRSIIQQHGGQIWAESTLDQGSTFYFSLPVLPTVI